MIDDETVATITGDNPYADRSRPVGPAKPTYNESVKLRDTGKNAEFGATPPPPGFVNPNPGGMLGADWNKASR